MRPAVVIKKSGSESHDRAPKYRKSKVVSKSCESEKFEPSVIAGIEKESKPRLLKEQYQVFYHYGAKDMLIGAMENDGHLSPRTLKIMRFGSTLGGAISVASNPLSSADYAVKHGASGKGALMVFLVKHGTKTLPLAGNKTWASINPKWVDGENVIVGVLTDKLCKALFSEGEIKHLRGYFEAFVGTGSPREYARNAFAEGLSAPQSGEVMRILSSTNKAAKGKVSAAMKKFGTFSRGAGVVSTPSMPGMMRVRSI